MKAKKNNNENAETIYLLIKSYENEIQNQLKIENYFGTVFFSTSLKTCQCRSKNVANVIGVAKKLFLITAAYSLGG